jgi:glycosyltransferase involved in cell wall biosynthesis
MLVSIITPVLNRNATIEGTIKSVLGQSHKEIEYIVIDGGSTDGTLDKVRKYSGSISKIVSEKDKGIYDAMNKGIGLSSGEIIGILNADDVYASDSVIETIVKTLSKKQVDACYGDLVYVDRINTHRIVRYWKSCEYLEGLFRKGWMPPHPTFFAKRWIYEKYGGFDLNLPTALDFEILFRFMAKLKIRTCYIPEVLVRMRMGGLSNNNILNIIKQNKVILKILHENGINVSPFFFYAKITEKLKQFR